MHLLTYVKFAHSVKIQRTFFVIVIAKDRENDDIKTAVFCRNEKVQIVQRLLWTKMLNKYSA